MNRQQRRRQMRLAGSRAKGPANASGSSISDLFQRGVADHRAGRLEQARAAYHQLLTITPAHADALHLLGLIARQTGRHDLAVEYIGQAIGLHGTRPDDYSDLGAGLRDFGLGRPDLCDAHYNLGNALYALGRPAEAEESYREALRLRPDDPEAHINLGNALLALGRLAEAEESYREALRLRPDYPEAHNNLGNTLYELERPAEAEASNREALRLRPDFPEAHYNLGMVLAKLSAFSAAVDSYDKAIANKPDYADAFHNRGIALMQLKQFDKAHISFQQALALAPAHKNAFSALADCSLKRCDWSRREELRTELRLHVIAQKSCIDPFTLLGYWDDEALQLASAQNLVSDLAVKWPRPLGSPATRRNKRIKIAYLSSDYGQHPVAYLTAGLFERHDRAQFDVIGVSLRRDDGSEIRARIAAAFDQFLDVSARGDEEVARLLKDLEVDIAVDLNGHTDGGRLGILACRPAPVQAAYLGYPGTTGTDFIDYIIADALVLPFSQQPHYTEKIIHLPVCYQVNDRLRKIAPRTTTRQEHGLPGEGLVFCCFNNPWKITPPIFDIWMRLLRAIENSMLWLTGSEETAKNLRKEAAAREIDPTRLVFAPQLPFDDHLARHRHADLFLDTLPYNAHATASNALWAGVPVLTCRGKAFAGRVAASLLNAAGLSELVAENLEDYERLALRLGTDEAFRHGVRERLRDNRLEVPLFDIDRFCRQIETAYSMMWERWQRGEPPHPFSVAGAPG
jgi:protein O-GlcNAc transferase